jgi:hypothetical protein
MAKVLNPHHYCDDLLDQKMLHYPICWSILNLIWEKGMEMEHVTTFNGRACSNNVH